MCVCIYIYIRDRMLTCQHHSTRGNWPPGKFSCQVERRYHSWDSNRQPLPWDLGISPPSSNSLGSSRTVKEYWSRYCSSSVLRHIWSYKEISYYPTTVFGVIYYFWSQMLCFRGCYFFWFFFWLEICLQWSPICSNVLITYGPWYTCDLTVYAHWLQLSYDKLSLKIVILWAL